MSSWTERRPQASWAAVNPGALRRRWSNAWALTGETEEGGRVRTGKDSQKEDGGLTLQSGRSGTSGCLTARMPMGMGAGRSTGACGSSQAARMGQAG